MSQSPMTPQELADFREAQAEDHLAAVDADWEQNVRPELEPDDSGPDPNEHMYLNDDGEVIFAPNGFTRDADGKRVPLEADAVLERIEPTFGNFPKPVPPALIIINNPDEPFGMPLFEGSSEDAANRLIPGRYAAIAATGIDAAPMEVVIANDQAVLYEVLPPFPQNTAPEPADDRDIAAEPAPADEQTPDLGAETGAQPAPADAAPSAAAHPAPAAERPQPEGIRVSVVGNLSAPPTFGYSANGSPYLQLTVASAERRRDSQGSWAAGPKQFTEVVVFGKAAERLANQEPPLAVGTRVEVTGRHQVDTFVRRDNTPGAALKVLATNITQPGLIATPAAAGHSVDRSPAAAIHHNAQHTVVRGVGRDDKELQGALKGAGFKWSAPQVAWYLPASTPFNDRAERIEGVAAALSEAGRDLPALTEGPDPGARHQGIGPAVGGTPFDLPGPTSMAQTR